MRTILFLAFSSLFLTSCEDFFSTTVKADPPEYDPQLVFHLLLSDQDSSIRLVLSRSYGLLEPVRDEKKWYISGATVEWWQAGQKTLTLTPLPGDSGFVYVGKLPQTLKPGEQYEVRVQHPDYPSARAVQTMPAKFEADSARVRRLSSNQFDELRQLDLIIRDQPGVENYYEVTVSRFQYFIGYTYVNGQLMIDTIGSGIYPVSFDEFLDRNTVTGSGNTALVSDQLFDGQAYKFQAKFYPNYSSSNDTMPTYTVQVRNITKDYYQWSRTYYQHYENEYEIFAEPVLVLNNVVGGLGVFGLGTEKVYQTK